MEQPKFNEFEKLTMMQEALEEEEATKFVMRHMLEIHGLSEEDIPSNHHLACPLSALLLNPMRLYRTLQTLHLNTLQCGDYVCFKIDVIDETEDIYFVSPTDVLYIEGHCLS